MENAPLFPSVLFLGDSGREGKERREEKGGGGEKTKRNKRIIYSIL